MGPVTISSVDSTWMEAKAICEKMGAKLLSLDSQEEAVALKAQVSVKYVH